MTNNGGLGKKIRISSYTRKGRLAMESVLLVAVEDEEEWNELKQEVYADHAEMGLTADIVELTERQWHIIRMERALEFPEWDDLEEPDYLPERISEN